MKREIYILSFFLYILAGVVLIYAQELKIETEKIIDEDGIDVFEKGKAYYERGEEELTIIELERLISDFPSSPLINETYFILGKIYHKRKEYSKTITYFNRLLEEFPLSEFAEEARYELAITYLEVGNIKEAISFLEIEVNIVEDSQKKIEIYQRLSDIYIVEGQYQNGIDALLKKRGLLEDEEKKIQEEEKIKDIIDRIDGEEILNSLMDVYHREFPGDYILIKFIEMYERRGDYYREEIKLKRFIKDFPNHNYYFKAISLLESIPVRLRSNRFLIGILLPMTGRLGPFSMNILKGIELAFEEFEESLPERFVGLVIKDYEGKELKMLYELKELINRYRPIAIIGPVLSKDVRMIASRIERAKVPMITPSATAPNLPRRGRYIFRDALTNNLQGRLIADYAINRLGLRRFVILYPDEPYGRDLMRIFSKEIERLEGEIVSAESYPPDETDFRRQIKRIKDADIKRYGREDVPEIEGEEGLEEEYIPGFDAIFLPGDYDKVGLIAPQLEFFDIKGVSLLGTNGWNSDELIRMGGRFIEGGVFVDGFFVGSSDPEVRRFVDRYRTKYQKNPDILAAQAYDIMKMILELLQGGVETKEEMRDSLLKIKDFHGASGLTTFAPDGDIEKRLFVIGIKDGKFVEMEVSSDWNQSELTDRIRH